MNELIDILIKESLIKKCVDKNSEIDRQKSVYKQLVKRAENNDLRVQYLANYDALLRLIEILLLDFGYMLNEQPHSTARRIINHLAPEFDISNAIKLRHQVKKTNHLPSLMDIKSLSLLRKRIEEISL